MSISRKICWLLGVLFLAPAFAWAQTCIDVQAPSPVPSSARFSTWESAFAVWNADQNTPSFCPGDGHGGCQTIVLTSCSPSGAPATAGLGSTCSWTRSDSFGHSGTGTTAFDSLSGSCPAGCAGLPNQDVLAVISGSSFTTAGGLICNAGCAYANGATVGSMVITGSSTSGGLSLIGKAVPTGGTCAAGDGSVSALSTDNCMSQGGTTLCHQASGNVATVNNDIVNPAVPPPSGQCEGYSDGAAICNAGHAGTVSVIAGPTTSGTLDTPAAVVTTSSDTIDYFSPAQVASSGTPVGGINAGNVAGNPAGTTGNGAGTVQTCTTAAGATTCTTGGTCTASAPGVTPVVTCTGTGTTAGTGTGAGDCDAASSAGTAGCADGTTPSLTRTDTAAGDASAMWAGIQGTPLFAAFGAVSTAFSSGGSCPSATFTTTTIHFTGNFMESFCAVFSADLSTMIAISDAAWSLLGLFILISA
jgi:hypothetical protein